MTKLSECIDKNFEHAETEASIKKLWDDTGIYKYNPDSTAEVFSVDTPPPYVSAAHLHVGHAMSYSQAEFIIRYQRMNGKNIFYPMGFDDNGLPTERYVEQTYKINKKKTTRSEFRQLCLDETAKGAKTYKELWKSLGLSVDWNQSLAYSTINGHCQRTSQKSFLDLFEKGRIYRSDEPVLWDTHFETALAQADLETMQRKGRLFDVAFTGEDGSELIISTTRPELIPGCVALYCNPNDERYKDLIGKTATVPLFDYQVPIKTSEEVDLEFGTGLMMVCTFGDAEDVKKWKEDKLDTRLVINPNGRMNELAGRYEGMSTVEAKANIVKDLDAAGFIKDKKTVDQNVSVAERSGEPVEFMMVPQWFIRILDMKETMLKRSAEINWNPDFMKVRLDDWINGLKYDWNISRQRFYGVPFPLWHCANEECSGVVLADEASLPIDPTETDCPADKCPKCGGTDFNGESDVMETWMTSSLTPLVNANWANSPDRAGSIDKIYPMTVRVQASEIIRSWLFYTVLKSEMHTETLPWKDVMISGWGLNEQGKKISKRSLESSTDANGFNRYNPEAVIEKYGADALRYWAAGSHLGNNLRYGEKDVKAGRKLVIKIWNSARFCTMQLDGFDPNAERMPISERTDEDRWLLNELNAVIKTVGDSFEKYDYATAREALERFFWITYCDNYLEITKDRFWNPERYTDEERHSAQCTLWESLRCLISLYAPMIPFVTESIYQTVFKDYEEDVSLHISKWPETNDEWNFESKNMATILSILTGVRTLRSQQQISQNRQLQSLTINLGDLNSDEVTHIKSLERSIMAAVRVAEVQYNDNAELHCEKVNVKIAISA